MARHAEAAQAMQHVGDLLRLLDRDRLGDLDAQPLRRQVPKGERLRHQVGHLGIEQVVGGDVDRHVDRHLRVTQLCQRQRRRLEQPAVEGVAQAGALDRRHDERRLYPLAVAPLPAQQGLAVHTATARDLHLRLDIQRQRCRRGLAQFGDQVCCAVLSHHFGSYNATHCRAAMRPAAMRADCTRWRSLPCSGLSVEPHTALSPTSTPPIASGG